MAVRDFGARLEVPIIRLLPRFLTHGGEISGRQEWVVMDAIAYEKVPDDVGILSDYMAICRKPV